MRNSKPVIGVTLSSQASMEQREQYQQALQEHGAIVEIITQEPDAGVRHLHGLVLGGGGDVDPEYFGQARHLKCRNVDAERDALEFKLLGQALTLGMPVLGICRGSQVLGIVLGARMIQDITSLAPNSIEHSSGDHEIIIARDSRLREIVGCERVQVNSSHHQANELVGNNVRAVAWSADGLIEAIEKPGSVFVIGVQWHPERMPRNNPARQCLFRAFVATARAGVRGE